NAGICLRKGDPVVVKGKLSVRTYSGKDGMPRTAVEVEASSVGHDLSKGVAQFARGRPQTGMSASEFAATQAGVDQGSPADGDGMIRGSDGPDTISSPALVAASDGLGSVETGEPFFDESAISELAADADREAVPF